MINPNRTAGFTLAEAMIAMVILATATAAVILPFSAGAAVHTEGAKQTMAAHLAAELLERIKNDDSMYLGGVEAQGMMFDANGQIYTDGAYGRFWRLWSCEYADVGGQSLKWATACVYYDDNEVLRMSTLVGP